MAKRKLDSCLISTLSFWLCFVVLVVAGTDAGSTDESTGADQNSNEAGGSASQISLVLERLETLKKKHQKLEKSHAELNQQFKSLRKEVEELRNENCVGEDVWLLTPPLRGRRGQKGEKGDSGLVPPKSGEKPVQIGGRAQLPSQSSTTPKADSGFSDSTFIAAPTTQEPTTVFPGGSQNPTTERITARPTTLITTEKVQSRPVGAAAAGAWVIECGDYWCTYDKTQHYDATRDGSCKTYYSRIKVKSVHLIGSCVTLYRNSDCSGNQFQLNTENSEKGRDVRNVFLYESNGRIYYDGPRSIGPCSQWNNA